MPCTRFFWTLVLLVVPWPSLCLARAPSFSPAQVSAGRVAYREHCAVCHGRRLEGKHLSPPLVGARFDRSFRGRSAGVLAFHLRRMPPEAIETSGHLNDETYTAILAYILKSNGFEAGAAALPPDSEALSALRIPNLKGVKLDVDAPVVAAGQSELLANLRTVTHEMLRNPSPKDWLHTQATYDGQTFSPLKQIHRENVGDLAPAWRAPLRNGSSMPMPLVLQGVMFLHTFPDTVLALDATNGQVLWRYRYEVTTGSSQKMGLALHGDKILVPTSNLHVLALNAKTGELIWDHEISPETPPAMRATYNLRSAPLVVGDKVMQGVTASFVPKGGFLVGIDAGSGKEVWRFNSIARPGEPHGNSWNDVPLEKRSGGSIWHQGTYDAELNLVYFGVAPTYDTGPLVNPVEKDDVTSNALYTNCTVAINPDSGELVWHYQHMPNDQWDLDWVFERQIVKVPVRGVMRKVVMNVGKMAVLEALDAATGEYLFSVDAGIQNVITAIDPETGAKTIDPEKWPDVKRPTVVCPSAVGARSWPPTSYSPETKLLYLPLAETCMRLGPEGMPLLTSGVRISAAEHPDSGDGMLGRLQAIDVVNQELAWTHHQATPPTTGLLATGGGLLFSGDMEPSVKAFDVKSGELLWQAELDDAPSSSIVTYQVEETQYVALVVGMNNFHVSGLAGTLGGFVAQSGTPRKKTPKGGAAIWVFALP